MPQSTTDCQLCGRSNPAQAISLSLPHGDVRFCCIGCRHVYQILLETTGTDDPEAFRQSDVYRRCRALGIIPGGSEDSTPEPIRRPESPQASDGLPLVLRIDGMYCMACAWVIEEVLYRQRGVLQAECQFGADRLYCRYDPMVVNPDRIADAVRSLGYGVAAPDQAATGRERRRLFVRFALSAFFTMNVMMLSAALYSGFVTHLDPDAIRFIAWPMVILATAVVGIGGWPILHRAALGLVRGVPGMDTLVALGAVSAYGVSLYQFWLGSLHLYFDTACMLVSLVLLGKFLERRALDAVADDVDGLLADVPAKVRIASEDHPSGKYAPVSRLRSGDLFFLETGEGIAADGRVVGGSATVDESALTGESRPVAKMVGDPVTSGTRVMAGALSVRANAVGGQSILGQTRAVIEAALSRKSAAETRTERWLRGFVPAIGLVAIVTAFGCLVAGHSIEVAVVRAVTVLVVACPCALGVAIPLARVAGLALAGRQGILARRFEVFSGIGRINLVVIDKTGTLTLGRWSLVAVEALPGVDPDQMVAWAAALEIGVDHPVALALTQAAAQRTDIVVSGGAVTRYPVGVAGEVAGRAVRVGTRQFAGGGPNASWPGNDPADALESRVYMTVDGDPVAVFRFADAVRPGAGRFIKSLARLGVEAVLVSGDTSEATHVVGRRIGISDCRGAMSPMEKQTVVDQFRAHGHRVAMIGDGINDAPALAAADLGVAVRGPGPVMADAADAVLMGGDPAQWIDFVFLARRVMNTIRWNLIGAWVYNIIAIPVAMVGWLSPPIAVVAMVASSLSVTGNTLRMMRRQRIHRSEDEDPG